MPSGGSRDRMAPYQSELRHWASGRQAGLEAKQRDSKELAGID